MKHRNFSTLTFGGLLFILVLQILWLCSVYTSLQRNVYKECNSILLKSIRRELSIRFQRAPKGTEIVSISIPSNSEQNDLAPEIIPLNEGLLKLGFSVMDGRANYLCFRAPGDENLRERLLGEGLLLRSCANYRGLGKDYYRTAVRTRKENERLLEAFGKVCGKNE